MNHADHSKSLEDFEKYFIDTYTWENVTDGKLIDTLNWRILPMKLVHNVECFGFLIINKLENKKIVYITDTSYIPEGINWKDVDCWIQDTNYSVEIVNEKILKGMQINLGYKNHMSIEYIADYINKHNIKPKNFVAFHISNSNLSSIRKIEEILSPLVENLILSKPNTVIEV